MILTPTYHVFEMYKVHQDATLLPVDLRCEEYQFGEETIPAVSASASRDEQGVMHLSLCNLNHEQAVSLSCEFRGMQPASVTGRVLTAEAINTYNTFEQPELIKPVAFNGATLLESTLAIDLPAKSVVVLELI
jgi:alpha-N-arabinofuranosidase